MNGTIKSKNEKKGFGFVRDEEGVEYFFHFSGLKNVSFDDLQIGDRVNFDGNKNAPKGARAENIRVTE